MQKIKRDRKDIYDVIKDQTNAVFFLFIKES